jgi:hypothetical protein
MDPLTLVSAGITVIQLALRERDKARERGEWTPAQDAAFDAKMEERFASAAWKPQAKSRRRVNAASLK